jgi:hypothetical protein
MVYGGLSASRECLGDFVMFDINREVWSTFAQSGFIPACPGRYNFGMTYDNIKNQIIVFGG